MKMIAVTGSCDHDDDGGGSGDDEDVDDEVVVFQFRSSVLSNYRG